jgi:hypothetical protein
MALSPEQLSKLKAIAAKIENEYDRDKFSILLTELMAEFEEADRLKHEVAQDVAEKRPASPGGIKRRARSGLWGSAD